MPDPRSEDLARSDEASRRTEDHVEFLDCMAEWLSEAAADASDPDRWHLENAAYFYRCRARQLRKITDTTNSARESAS